MSDYFHNNQYDQVGTYDHDLGVLVLKSQSIAKKTGPWTFKEHTRLEEIVKELLGLRDSIGRYSTRIQIYRDAIHNTIEAINREIYNGSYF